TTLPLAFTPLATLVVDPGKEPRPWKKHWGPEVAGVAVAKATTETKTRSRLFFHDGESVACMRPPLPRTRPGPAWAGPQASHERKCEADCNDKKSVAGLRMIECCRRPCH